MSCGCLWGACPFHLSVSHGESCASTPEPPTQRMRVPAAALSFPHHTQLAWTLWPMREHTGPVPQALGPHALCRTLPGHTVVYLLFPLAQGPLNSWNPNGRIQGFSHRAKSKFNYGKCLLTLGVRECLCSASLGSEASRASSEGPNPCFNALLSPS